MTSGSCGSCTFFDEHHANGGASTTEAGLCRFNPPVSQPGPDVRGLWPVVSDKDWCGHFQAETVGGLAAAE